MAWSIPKTWVTGEVVDATDLNTYIRDQFNAVFPVGSFLLWAHNYTSVEFTYENRWIQCNGAAVSRTTYAALFNWLNSLSPALPFGSGDGSTTFTLPDLRGRAAWAEGEHANVDSMGDSDGAAIANRTPKHWHTVSSIVRNNQGASNVNAFGSGDVGAGSAATSYNTSLSASTPQDNPAYLVVGSYFIKYTS